MIEKGVGASRSIWLVLAAVGVALATSACSDLLDETPTEAVPPEVVGGDAEALESVLNSAYQRLQSQGQGGQVYWSEMLIVPEVLADNARASSPPNQLQGQAVNQVGSHIGQWGERYEAINEANFVISRAPDLPEASDAVKARLEGEARFLRALNYFDLARIYAYEPGREVGDWNQGVVLRTEPTEGFGDADFRERASVAETYQQIETDLMQSIELLSQAGRSDAYFANLAAAQALLGRVHLYWENWDQAVSYSSDALGNTSARLATEDEYPGIFQTQPNPESLFEYPLTQFNQFFANYCMSCYLRPDRFFSIWPSQELIDLYGAGDVRSGWFGVEDGVTYVANKWTESVDLYMDNIPILRYSEVLLNRAEAYAELGQEELARQDLDALRAERGLGPVVASGQELIDAILEERRRELAFEGHRWFDLKRRGMDIPKPASTGLGPLPYSDFRLLAPLPNNEVQGDELLDQNPGY